MVVAERKPSEGTHRTIQGMPAAPAAASDRFSDVPDAVHVPPTHHLPTPEPRRSPSTLPPPVGPEEGHDAWTVQRVSRRSTPPISVVDPAYLSPETLTLESEIPALARAKRMSQAPRAPRVPRELTRGGALDLVDRSRPSQAAMDLPSEMEELYALGDFTGALVIADLILGTDPTHAHAARCAESCRGKLIQLYTSKIGSLAQIPISVMNDSDMRWLGLDHRAGFLLSRVDGYSSVDEILDVCGMARLEALKTIVELIERGAISFVQP